MATTSRRRSLPLLLAAAVLWLTACSPAASEPAFEELVFSRGGCTPGSTTTLTLQADGTGEVVYNDGTTADVKAAASEVEQLQSALTDLSALEVDFPKPTAGSAALDIFYFDLRTQSVHWQWNEREQPEEIEDLTILLNQLMDGA